MESGLPLVDQMAKSPPAMQETQVQSLGWKGPLEKGMASHSSILAWRIPRTEKPGRLQSMGHRVGHDRATNTFTSFFHFHGSEDLVLNLKRFKENCKVVTFH